MGSDQSQVAAPVSTTTGSSASSRATRTWRSSTGRAIEGSTGTSIGSTGPGGRGDSPDRYKASKQADVLMLFYLLSDDDLPGSSPGWATVRIRHDFARHRVLPGANLTFHLSKVFHAGCCPLRSGARLGALLRGARERPARPPGRHDLGGVHLGAMADVDLVQRAYTGIEHRRRCCGSTQDSRRAAQAAAQLRYGATGASRSRSRGPDQDHLSIGRRLSDQGRHQGEVIEPLPHIVERAL